MLEIIKWLMEWIRVRHDRRMMLLEKVLEPTFARIMEIHRDYSELFRLAIKKVPTAEMGPDQILEVVNLLEERRLRFLPERDALVASMKVLAAEARSDVIRNFAESSQRYLSFYGEQGGPTRAFGSIQRLRAKLITSRNNGQMIDAQGIITPLQTQLDDIEQRFRALAEMFERDKIKLLGA